MDPQHQRHHGPGGHRFDPHLLKLAQAGQLDPGWFVTHHFDLHEMMEAYDVFGHAAETRALKVVLTRS